MTSRKVVQNRLAVIDAHNDVTECAVLFSQELLQNTASQIIVFVENETAEELIFELIECGGFLLSRGQRKKLPEALRQFSCRSAAEVLHRWGVSAPERNFLICLCRTEREIYFQNGRVPILYILLRQDISETTEQFIRRNCLSGDIVQNVYSSEDRSDSMDISSDKLEQIVKEVLAGMKGQDTAPAAVKPSGGAIPKTSRVAMLTALEHYDIKEYPIPEIGDDDILVKVEGCGVCGTDAHEFKRDPFGLIPVVLGHEGTGEIVKMGKNVKKDSAGKPLALGDKVVTCMIFKDNPDITMFDLNKQNVGGADVYGLLPDDDIHLNGWFGDYLVVRGGSTIFNVSDLDLDMRILIEPCAVLIHAVERAKSTGILRFNSRVVVQGCGPIGLICIAVLRTMGIENIVAVDGEDKRLAFAAEMGADHAVNFKNYQGIEALTEGVKSAFGGYEADFAFQCTGSPVAHSNIYKFIRNGGGLCELGFFINGGDATINPHFDICSKEITTVGSWVYTLRDYVTTFDFLKRAKAIGLPLEKLITHRFPLERINEAHPTNLKMEGLKIAIINE